VGWGRELAKRCVGPTWLRIRHQRFRPRIVSGRYGIRRDHRRPQEVDPVKIKLAVVLWSIMAGVLIVYLFYGVYLIGW
jgi:hypothetical protein